jgi:PIN domain nuclease of toxin-antitoxin system
MDRRFLLDTNIVIFALQQSKEIENWIWDILNDYNNLFYVSTASIQEMIHLHQRGKIHFSVKKTEDILPMVEDRFRLLPVKREHLATYAALSIPAEHNDPNDHIIISQAITERMTLVSSDRKFDSYTRQKLVFLFNNR